MPAPRLCWGGGGGVLLRCVAILILPWPLPPRPFQFHPNHRLRPVAAPVLHHLRSATGVPSGAGCDSMPAALLVGVGLSWNQPPKPTDHSGHDMQRAEPVVLQPRLMGPRVTVHSRRMGGFGTRPRCEFVCVWRRLLASRPCASRPSVGPNVFWLCQRSPWMTCPV